MSLATTLSKDDLAKGCVAWDPARDNAYHYVPNMAAGVIFCVFFGISVLAHITQTIMSRKWWYSAFALGAIGELIGWAARTKSHYCPYQDPWFTLQISILIIAPCFFSAGLYYIELQLIRIWGRSYSLISTKLYLWIFIGFDLLSIALQGTGGGLASSAFNQTPTGNTAPGTHIMLAGIIIQLVSMSVFSILLLYTVVKAQKLWLGSGSSSGIKLLIGAVMVSDLCILARNFYRAVELGEGWGGAIIANEALFCVFDAMLMVFAGGVFNFVYPAGILKREEASRHAVGAGAGAKEYESDGVATPAAKVEGGVV